MESTFRKQAGNWLIGTVGPFKVQAKVFTEPSHYGMLEDPRISKLSVQTAGVMLYNYDRGLDRNHLTANDLAEIVAAVAKEIR